jgi:protein O-GlcNAc transferase
MKSLILTTSLLGLPFVMLGCNGPTSTGKEARTAAYDRVNLLNAQVNFDQARQAFSTGQFDKALKEINIAIDRAPEQAPYYVLRGRILMETHRLEKALESFDEAIERDKALAEAHYFRGVVFERWSDDQKALDCYQTAFDAESSNLQYLLATTETFVAMGQLDAAKSILEAKLTYFEHHAAIYELLGRIAMLQNDPREAAARLSRASMLSPEDATLKERLAQAQFDSDQIPACLRTILDLQRQCGEAQPDLVRMKARCFDLSGRHEEARNLYAELTSRDPSDLQSWIELASVAHALGDLRRVGYCGARVTALAPDRFEGYMFKGLYEESRHEHEKAMALLQEAASRAKESAAPHILLGLMLTERGQSQAALNAFADALRVEPDNAQARVLMAQVETD